MRGGKSPMQEQRANAGRRPVERCAPVPRRRSLEQRGPPRFLELPAPALLLLLAHGTHDASIRWGPRCIIPGQRRLPACARMPIQCKLAHVIWPRRARGAPAAAPTTDHTERLGAFSRQCIARHFPQRHPAAAGIRAYASGRRSVILLGAGAANR